MATVQDSPAAPPPPSPPPPRHNPWPTLIAVRLGLMTIGLDGTVVGAADPTIDADAGAVA